MGNVLCIHVEDSEKVFLEEEKEEGEECPKRESPLQKSGKLSLTYGTP